MNAQNLARTVPCRGLILAVVLVAGGAAHAAPSDEALKNLMENYWEAQVRAAPLAATLWGEIRYRDRVDDISPEALAANGARLDETIAQLAEIDSGDLSPANREHYEAFEWMLTNERRNLDFDTRYFTFNSLGGWHSRFADLILATPYSSEQDYLDLLMRLRGFGAYARQNLDLLRLGIESGYTQPCQSLKGFENSIAGYIAEPPEGSVFRATVRRYARFHCRCYASRTARSGPEADRRGNQSRLPGVCGVLRQELLAGLPRLRRALLSARRAEGLQPRSALLYESGHRCPCHTRVRPPRGRPHPPGNGGGDERGRFRRRLRGISRLPCAPTRSSTPTIKSPICTASPGSPRPSRHDCHGSSPGSPEIPTASAWCRNR